MFRDTPSIRPVRTRSRRWLPLVAAAAAALLAGCASYANPTPAAPSATAATPPPANGAARAAGDLLGELVRDRRNTRVLYCDAIEGLEAVDYANPAVFLHDAEPS